MDAAVARSTGVLRICLALALTVVLAGCGDDAAEAPARETDRSVPAAAVTRADARLSVTTHRGVNSLSGLRLQGTCSGGTVRVDVGHAPPYKPLRKVGNPQIDSITPPESAALTGRCVTGRFVIRRRQLSVRLGGGPLRVTLSGGEAVDIRIKSFGIE